MRKCALSAGLILAVFSLCQLEAVGQKQKLCSTETVNPNCVVHFDRRYPVTLPTFQMRAGAKVTVVLDNPLPFEAVTLDPQSSQAIAGTDQTAGLLTALGPGLKSVFVSGGIKNSPQAFNLLSAEIGGEAGFDGGNPSPSVQKVIDDLNALTGKLNDVYGDTRDMSYDATQVYLQLQEVSSSLPRPVTFSNNNVRDDSMEDSPDPWTNYQDWRRLVLAELLGSDCPDTNPACAINIRDVLTRAADLKLAWTLVPNSGGGECAKDHIPCSYPAFSPAKQTAFDILAVNTTQDIDVLKGTPGQGFIAAFSKELAEIKARKDEIVASLPASGPVISAMMDSITKDLSNFAANIYLADGTSAPICDANPPVPGGCHDLGSIYDPIFSPNPANSHDHPNKRNIVFGFWPLMRLGRQAVFAVNVVNLVNTSQAAIPTAAQKKSIATVTVVYADPIFEVSAGTFFSWIPTRSISNQTNVGVEPDGTTTNCLLTVTPVLCSVSIIEQDKHPTVVPFVAGNWRLGHDFAWPDGRRGAIYATTALGINPNSTSTEYAGGLSLSWRALMLSPMWHLGRDLHLTQGETVGEIWCYYNPPAAVGTNPAPNKCSGNPPAPSTKQFWRGAFAIGISVRVPSVFSAAGH
jgi:hypothetical protein